MIHPRAIVNAYGANVVCVYMASVRLGGQQFRMCTNSLISNRNIITKLWNLGWGGRKAGAQNVICCRLAAFNIYNKLMCAELQLRSFGFDSFVRRLVGLVKGI